MGKVSCFYEKVRHDLAIFRGYATILGNWYCLQQRKPGLKSCKFKLSQTNDTSFVDNFFWTLCY